MALLLLSLALGLAAAQDFNPLAVVHKNYNMARLAGVWYSISIASDNLTRIEENGDLRLFIERIQVLKNSSLQFDFRIMLQGQCVSVTVVCDQAESSGEFSIVYEGNNQVLLFETDYTMYNIFYMKNVQNGTVTQLLALYGRIPELSKIFHQRFSKTCQIYGLGSQNIIELSNQDYCFFNP